MKRATWSHADDFLGTAIPDAVLDWIAKQVACRIDERGHGTDGFCEDVCEQLHGIVAHFARTIAAERRQQWVKREVAADRIKERQLALYRKK